MPSIPVKTGDAVPLSLTMENGATGLFPQAVVYNSIDVQVAGSPFDLTEVGATGRYTSAGFTPTIDDTYTALFITYTDVGHTTESTAIGRVEESYPVSFNATISLRTSDTGGSSSTAIRTAATQVDNFFNGMILIVSNSAGIAARQIDDYALVDGIFTVSPALPFTPSSGDPVIVLSRLAFAAIADPGAVADAVWDELAADHNLVATFGRLLNRLTAPLIVEPL